MLGLETQENERLIKEDKWVTQFNGLRPSNWQQMGHPI